MTFDQALQATPLVAQIFFIAVGAIFGLIPSLMIWSRLEEWKARFHGEKKILKIREEYIKELQELAQRDRDRFHKLTLDLLTEETPKSANLDLN
jgi:hypothetical protein